MNPHFTHSVHTPDRGATRWWIVSILLIFLRATAVEAGQYLDFSYTFAGANVGITKYTGPGGLVTIPDTIEEMPVTSVSGGTFYKCATLTQIVLPNGVTSIERWAFLGCSNLSSVRLPRNLTDIFDSAFAGCATLKSISLPNGVTGIANGAFSGCTRLTTVYFEGNAPTFGVGVFDAGKVTVYRRAGTTGWLPTLADCPVVLWDSAVSYQEWAMAIGLLAKFPEAGGETDDADQDGLVNLAEMLAGTDPTDPNSRWSDQALMPGSLDDTYEPRPDGEIMTIKVLPDGKALIGGAFTRVNGWERAGVARLHRDGKVDQSFIPWTGSGDWPRPAPVKAVLPLADGSVLVGGSFIASDGKSRPCLARLNSDGSFGTAYRFTSSSPGISGYGELDCLATQPDGLIYLGGLELYAGYVGETMGRSLVRMKSDGSLDLSFKVDLYGWAHGYGHGDPVVKSINILPNGQILVFGPDIGGPALGVVLLNPDGSADRRFPGGPTADWQSPANRPGATAVAVQPDGKVVIGHYHGLNRLDVLGTRDPAFEPRMSPEASRMYVLHPIRAIRPQANGSLLVSGQFDTMNGGKRNQLARLTPAGANENAFSPYSFNPNAGTDVPATVIELQADGQILLGGSFGSVNGVARKYLARLHGDQDRPDARIPRLRAARGNAATDGIINLTIAGIPGGVYQLERSADLAAWTPVRTLTNVIGTVEYTEVAPPNQGQVFYRAKQRQTGE